jgi:hypothetical protein
MSGFRQVDRDERRKAFDERTRSGVDYLKTDLAQFNPKDGDNCIRIVPCLGTDPWYPDKVGTWGLDCRVVFLAGHGYFVVEVGKGGKTPLSNLFAELEREVRKQDPEEARQFRGSRRTVMFMLDLNLGEISQESLKIWPAAATLVDDFVRASKNKRTGELIEIEHPEHGRPIFFERVGSGRSTKYQGVQVDQEALPLDQWMAEKLPHFEDILVIKSVEDAEQAIASYLEGGGDSNQEDTDSRPVRRREEPAAAAPEPEAPPRQFQRSPAPDVDVDADVPRSVEGGGNGGRQPVTIEGEAETVNETPAPSSGGMDGLRERIAQRLNK